MLIKKKLRERKKRREDIPERGGEEKELRREEKRREKTKGCWCFLNKGKKKRRVCCEMRYSSLFVGAFY